MCQCMQNTKNVEIELEKYSMKMYNDPRGRFDPIGKIRKVKGSFFIHEFAVEDDWANCEE